MYIDLYRYGRTRMFFFFDDLGDVEIGCFETPGTCVNCYDAVLSHVLLLKDTTDARNT